MKKSSRIDKSYIPYFQWSPTDTLFWHSFWPIYIYMAGSRHRFSDILSDILSDIYFAILSGILSGTHSDILSDRLSGILLWHSFWHSVSGILSDICSDILFANLSASILTLCSGPGAAYCTGSPRYGSDGFMPTVMTSWHWRRRRRRTTKRKRRRSFTWQAAGTTNSLVIRRQPSQTVDKIQHSVATWKVTHPIPNDRSDGRAPVPIGPNVFFPEHYLPLPLFLLRRLTEISERHSTSLCMLFLGLSQACDSIGHICIGLMKTALSLWYALQTRIELALYEEPSITGEVSDVIKAYNTLPRISMIAAAVRLVIDARVVRAWSTATVALQRHFMVQSSPSAPVASAIGFVEGCGPSVTAMLMMSVFPLHVYLQRVRPAVSFHTFANNCQLEGQEVHQTQQALVSLDKLCGLLWSYMRKKGI